MIDELESELRSILGRAGDDITVPPQVRQRLLKRRYHPRTVKRRLAAGITAAAAAAAVGTAIAVTTLTPASHHTPAVQLTAWTVVTRANGNIVITIRELRHPNGLQHTLRADGIPASVIFGNHQNRSCRPYPASEDLISAVFPAPQPPPRTIQVIIHPSALPAGAGVQIGDRATGRTRSGEIGVGLVHATQRCTGR